MVRPNRSVVIMQNIARALKFSLPAHQSAFLWGPRKTGKTTLLKQAFPRSLYFNFLDTDLFWAVVKQPSVLRERILAADPQILKFPVILDEVQKVPAVLDEVHWLIEEKKLRFILCGSSARKLKRGQANLLGGRAWRYELFPLTSRELGEIDLLKALNNGLVPPHYFEADATRSLKAYVQDYLKEEVFSEGLARNIPAFSRFFDAMAYSQGEIVNYSNIARECGVDFKTVREYYHILIDTLLGRFVEPFKRRQDRGVILRAPKFYMFDVGVANAVAGRRVAELKGEIFGRAFEHFILMEIIAYRGYHDIDFPVHYWRTKGGAEVDFVLGKGEIALEVKGSSRVDNNDLRAIKTFQETYKPKKTIVVSNEKAARQTAGALVLPWREFLSQLWQGKII